METLTHKEIRAAASAIANARGNRRGVPTITNILEMLPKKLFDEVMEDAEAALKACAGAQTKVFSGSIEAIKEVARLQGVNRGLLEALIALADDVEKVARDSYATVKGPFERDWQTEDPEGYAVWKKAHAAIAKAEGR